MSSRSRDWSTKGCTVALPNIPKMSDEKGRIKYLTDYEKYESEFLKHHLGNAENSYTLTLKQIPQNFDRQIPSSTEPTLAEREYERYVQAELKRMQKRNRARRVARATGALVRAATPAEAEEEKVLNEFFQLERTSVPKKLDTHKNKLRKTTDPLSVTTSTTLPTTAIAAAAAAAAATNTSSTSISTSNSTSTSLSASPRSSLPNHSNNETSSKNANLTAIIAVPDNATLNDVKSANYTKRDNDSSTIHKATSKVTNTSDKPLADLRHVRTKQQEEQQQKQQQQQAEEDKLRSMGYKSKETNAKLLTSTSRILESSKLRHTEKEDQSNTPFVNTTAGHNTYKSNKNSVSYNAHSLEWDHFGEELQQALRENERNSNYEQSNLETDSMRASTRKQLPFISPKTFPKSKKTGCNVDRYYLCLEEEELEEKEEQKQQEWNARKDRREKKQEQEKRLQTSHHEVFSAEECAYWLRLLINPPNEFVESFHLSDLEYFDLSWMNEQREQQQQEPKQGKNKSNYANTNNNNNNNSSNVNETIHAPRSMCNLQQFLATLEVGDGHSANMINNNLIASHSQSNKPKRSYSLDIKSITDAMNYNTNKKLKINSPRSVLTLVKSGISVNDLIPSAWQTEKNSFMEQAETLSEIRKRYMSSSKSVNKYNQTSSISQETNQKTVATNTAFSSNQEANNIDCSIHSNNNNNNNKENYFSDNLQHISHIIQQHRVNRAQRHKEQLASQLLRSYIHLCSKVSLPELLEAYSSLSQKHLYNNQSNKSAVLSSSSNNRKKMLTTDSTVLGINAGHDVTDPNNTWPTSLQVQHQKQLKLLQLHKERIKRQTEMAQELKARQQANEQRSRLIAEAALRSAAEKQAEERQRRLEQEERLAAQQAAKMAREEAITQEQERKKEKLNERNKRRAAQREELLQSRHEVHKRKEEIRQERLAQHQALIEQRASELAAKEEARNKEIEQLQLKRNERLAKEHAQLVERQSRAEESRRAVLKRAEKHELEVRQAAIERQMEVERRINEFNAQREEIQRRKMEIEHLKEKERQQKKESSIASEEAYKNTLRLQQLAHEVALSQLKQQELLHSIVRSEYEREEMKAKAFAVARHQRRDEFKKLITATELMKKRGAAEFVSSQREAMLAEMLKERDALNEQRDELKRQMNTII